jgi:nicotinamidase-related amidase
MSLLPIPTHFQPNLVGEIWRVPYQQRATDAIAWRKQFGLQGVDRDGQGVILLAIDVQNTFCLPEFELFVGGQNGRGAIEDNVRLCEFIYRNLGKIDHIVATLDTHQAMQIFHPIFWVNENGEHPIPSATQITLADLDPGTWRVNSACGDAEQLQAYARHYVQQLTQGGKYPLTIWPYHSMLGGIGHALVPAVEEAIFFHGIARQSQANFSIKGNNALTENYSALAPEVFTNQKGENIATKNRELIDYLLGAKAVIIAGQAKSHCVAATVGDLLTEIQAIDPSLAQKVYLLADCTSPVVIPGVVDYTEPADAAYTKFAQAGMQIVRSTDDFLH